MSTAQPTTQLAGACPPASTASELPNGAGMLWGLLGVLGFSLTLPFTRIAVAELDPMFVGLGRAVLAGACAAVLLFVLRVPRPRREHAWPLVLVVGGVVIGFPMFSSLAMRAVPASHGAVLIGLLPLATAVVAVVRGHERPSPAFWWSALAGSALVIGYAVHEALRLGHGLNLHAADAALLMAVACAAIGYAEGGRLAQTLGGWQTICWALVMSIPVLLPVAGWRAWESAPAIAAASPRDWIAFGYVGLVSMFLAFFAWYHGLALGGIAHVGQIQLVQIFFTLAFAASFFGETVPMSTWGFAVAVIVAVACARRARVARVLPKGNIT